MKKWLKLFACLIFVLSVLSTSYYSASNQNHECTGEDCPICLLMAVSAANHLSDTTPFTAAKAAFIILAVIAAVISLKLFFTTTPITLKTKLLN